MEPHGVVSLLYPEEGYGFIETSMGDEILFNRKSVLNGALGRLKPGSKVRSLPALRARGKTPEPSTVRIIRKHNLVDME